MSIFCDRFLDRGGVYHFYQAAHCVDEYHVCDYAFAEALRDSRRRHPVLFWRMIGFADLDHVWVNHEDRVFRHVADVLSICLF